MIFQLCVFSLLTLFLFLVGQLSVPVAGGVRGGVSRALSVHGERLDAVIRDAVRTYALFAPYALLMYLQGKPDLLPQYLAWLVILLSLVKGVLLFWSRASLMRWVGMLIVAMLIFLWLQQLPIFQGSPA
jgi:uncharacterized MAPEG superfamily protein